MTTAFGSDASRSAAGSRRRWAGRSALAGLLPLLLALLLLIAAPIARADFQDRVDYTLTNQSGKDFSGQQLAGSSFAGATGRQARFRDADLHGAILTQAAFPDADFRGADLRDALMDKVDMSGADLTGAVLRGAIDLVVLQNRQLRRIPLREDEAVWACIPPGVPHSAINRGRIPALLVNAVLRHGPSDPRDYEPHPVPLRFRSQWRRLAVA